MKKTLFVVLGMIISLGLVALSLAGGQGKMALKVGDETYACNCGEACHCDTMSNNAGKCTCGKEMVKAKVVRIDGEKAYLKAEGWEKERALNTVGKYVCACGPECKCYTISQNPGKCTCGVEMKKAGTK